MEETNIEPQVQADNTAETSQHVEIPKPAESTEKPKAGGIRHIGHHVKKNKTYLIAFGLYLLIALVMFWQVTLNATSRIVNATADGYQSLFNLWWVPYSIFTLHQSPYFTNLLYYPIGANFITQTMTPIAGILAWPLWQLSSALAYNALFFSSFALSGIFMFMLSEHFIKNRHAAFLAGLIYAFSPIHIAHSYAHLDWTLVEWIPLYILLLFKTVEEKRIVYPVLAGLSFVLVGFMGDLQQGILVLFFTITTLMIMLAIKHYREMLLNLQTLLRLAVVPVSILAIGSPFFIFILPNAGSQLSAAQQGTSQLTSMLWSNDIASFFLPGYYNGIFHGISASYLNKIYSLTIAGTSSLPDIAERTSYIGYSVLALIILGIYYDYKQHRLRNSVLWIATLALYALLSLGPYLQFYSNATTIPSIYALYSHVPILNIIREPGRFDFIATVALAVLAAIGFSHISKNRSKGDSLKYMAIFAIMILIEYNGMPLSSSFANSLTMTTAIPKAYGEMAQVPGNFSVLVLPILHNQNSSTPELYPGIATYYETALKKPIIGGYATRVNASQQLSVQYIPLAVSALYLQYGQGLAYPSPISQNVTNATLFWMLTDRIAYVSIIRNAYTLSEQQELYAYLYGVFSSPVYQDNSTFVFQTSGAVGADAGKSIVAYPLGNWQPGFTICQALYCNVDTETMWFGSGYRGMIVYAPNVTKTRINFQAASYLGTAQMSIYLQNQPVATVQLTNRSKDYSVSVVMPQGYNQISFLVNNGTILGGANQSGVYAYFTFGMRNISIQRNATFRSQ
ncbi:MAG: hypothetical protein KGH74_04755 [Candidatus Micrarchaeota archaeon]|nr:hypothetical protein [Candidatus Micrarchaeota archaeon]